MCFVVIRNIKHFSTITAQKMNFSIKDFTSKCDQIRSFLRIWSHLLEKSLMVNFIFCAMYTLLKYTHFSVFSVIWLIVRLIDWLIVKTKVHCFELKNLLKSTVSKEIYTYLLESSFSSFRQVWYSNLCATLSRSLVKL